MRKLMMYALGQKKCLQTLGNHQAAGMQEKSLNTPSSVRETGSLLIVSLSSFGSVFPSRIPKSFLFK